MKPVLAHTQSTPASLAPVPVRVAVPVMPAVTGPRYGAAPVSGVDLVLAQQYADKVLASIDWTRQDLLINVPGTGDRMVLAPMRVSIAGIFPELPASAFTLMDYPTDANFRKSVPMGMEVLRLTLAGIAAHSGDHRVFLFGQSQGAILIGETMANPQLSAMVERATMWGHPWVAHTDYPIGVTGRLWHYSNPQDPIAWPLVTDARKVINTLGRLAEGDFPGVIPDLVINSLRNAHQGIQTLLWLGRGKVFPESWMVDPHGYDKSYDGGFSFIREGMAQPLEGAAELARRKAAVLAAVSQPLDMWSLFRADGDHP